MGMMGYGSGIGRVTFFFVKPVERACEADKAGANQEDAGWLGGIYDRSAGQGAVFGEVVVVVTGGAGAGGGGFASGDEGFATESAEEEIAEDVAVWRGFLRLA